MDQHDRDRQPAPQAATISVRNLVTLFVWAAALALFFYFLDAFRLLFLGVLGAGCLAAALFPLTRYVPAGRGVSAIVVGVAPVLLIVAVIVLASWLMAGPVKRELRQWPEVRQKLNDTLGRWSERIGLERPVTVQSLLGQSGQLLDGSGGAEVLRSTTSAVSGVAIAIAFVLFGSIFMLAESPARLVEPVIAALPPPRREQIRGALGDLVPRLRWWVLGTLVSMSIVFAAAWAGFAVVGLGFALPLALLAGAAEIVPTVGPAAAFLVALLFAATQGVGTVVAVAVVYLVIQLVESYVIVPLVMKKAVKMPPLVTLFTVVLWGKVFGAAGLFLAIPINLVLWSFYDHLVLRPRGGNGGEDGNPEGGSPNSETRTRNDESMTKPSPGGRGRYGAEYPGA